MHGVLDISAEQDTDFVRTKAFIQLTKPDLSIIIKV